MLFQVLLPVSSRHQFFNLLSLVRRARIIFKCYGFTINTQILLTGDIHAKEFFKSYLQISSGTFNNKDDRYIIQTKPRNSASDNI